MRKQWIPGLSSPGKRRCVEATAALAKQRPPKESATKIWDNLPPVPSKLADRITRSNFVAMHELLLEYLADSSNATGPANARTGTEPQHLAAVVCTLCGSAGT